jgi:hypothetical protein
MCPFTTARLVISLLACVGLAALVIGAAFLLADHLIARSR